jgi:CubicO group peptidase (beta-lactamase class C family)
MTHRKGLHFLSSVFVFLLLSCGGRNEVLVAPEFIDEDQARWTDSIFGVLSPKEQYYQHLVIEIPAGYQNAVDSLATWVAANQPGALSFTGWHPDSVQRLKMVLDTLPIVKPFFYANYFDLLGATPYPFWQTGKAARRLAYTQVFGKAGYQLLNFEIPVKLDKTQLGWLDSIRKKQFINPVVANFDDRNARNEFDEFIATLRNTDHAVKIDLSIFDTVNFETYRVAQEYEGLFIVRAKESAINNVLKGGADFVFRRLEAPETFSDWKPSAAEQEIFEAATRRILNGKRRNELLARNVHASEELNFVALNMQQKSTVLLNNKSKMVPLKKVTLYSADEVNIGQKVRADNGITVVRKEIDLKNTQEIIASKGNKILLLDDSCDAEILKELNATAKDKNVLVGFTNPVHYHSLKDAANLFFYPQFNHFDHGILVQQLSARLPLTGNLVLPDSLVEGIDVSRKQLARTDPNFCGIDKDTLARISGMMSSCMSNNAFPGGQVLIAKNGCIIYDRCFGNLSYADQKPVNETTMYDLASITKVVATTLVGMKLYEMNAYELNDSLAGYLPDSLNQHLKFPSTIRNLTFQQLFIHETGMPAGFPIYRYMKYTTAETGRFDRYYCDQPDDTCFTIEICDNYYMEREYQDSMWLKLNQIFLNPNKEYHYSDVNMNTLYFMFKSIIQKNPERYGFTQPKKQLADKDLFAEYLYTTFYKPLGMAHTCYKPLRQFSKDNIAPTENEMFWRKQLLQGHVHDPNAAMHGGIAGNAGIFSTANDLAILCQMWLNKGVYNGQRYLSAETVDKFTSRQENSHRGLGFNKPTISSTSFGMSENASMATYGHTGFTGTCFWVDPEHELIYIYLTNAVHPKVSNKDFEYGIRKKVHQCAYDAMMLEEF